MQLNHDCVRDVLLHIEENLEYGYYMNIADVELKNYSREELLYTSDKLLEAGYLIGDRMNFLGSALPGIRITSISWDGHQFLDNIRDDGIWKDTKNILSKFSSVSLSFVGNIASQVITSLVQKQLGLQ